jgi:hypothetical protein
VLRYGELRSGEFTDYLFLEKSKFLMCYGCEMWSIHEQSSGSAKLSRIVIILRKMTAAGTPTERAERICLNCSGV